MIYELTTNTAVVCRNGLPVSDVSYSRYREGIEVEI
ncbi:MAG TPA: GNAT family N-acetyltransferase [Candidatus Eisenbergiella intestinipullorum]|nr:GNAT family N-acetyltransferase [Candidatus Eisenbergiella intestinipullorum]